MPAKQPHLHIEIGNNLNFNLNKSCQITWTNYEPVVYTEPSTLARLLAQIFRSGKFASHWNNHSPLNQIYFEHLLGHTSLMLRYQQLDDLFPHREYVQLITDLLSTPDSNHFEPIEVAYIDHIKIYDEKNQPITNLMSPDNLAQIGADLIQQTTTEAESIMHIFLTDSKSFSLFSFKYAA